MERIYSLLQDALFTDFTLIISQANDLNIKFDIHRIFAIQSPVMGKAIYLNESTLMLSSSVYISKSAMQLTLKSLYLDIEIEKDMFIPVLRCSRLLGLDVLAERCLGHLVDSIDSNSIIDIANYCYIEEESAELEEAVSEYLLGNLFLDLVDEYGLVWNEGKAYTKATEILSRIPFAMFKETVESSRFDCPNDHQRFEFAKGVVGARKDLDKSLQETVLLTFGSKECGVKIFQKRRSNGRKMTSLIDYVNY